jgi:hypothetical protein
VKKLRRVAATAAAAMGRRCPLASDFPIRTGAKDEKNHSLLANIDTKKKKVPISDHVGDAPLS